jgi:hypothetical protein
MTEPRYPTAAREVIDERADCSPRVAANPPRHAQGSSPQGEHHAAGGRPEHHRPDGGTQMGHQAPSGWPPYHRS